ncbi:hypothetical protein CEXT_669971 [Caerostris extrusa]|uniref:Uncharacterized protein n=1 Tax=Caerostris extrusa TaxID=172846 RepID=A0AAV4NZ53_CAEEX|nr:hypothetical protein CEXT_669971 [Caerostris extrusa]
MAAERGQEKPLAENFGICHSSRRQMTGTNLTFTTETVALYISKSNRPLRGTNEALPGKSGISWLEFYSCYANIEDCCANVRLFHLRRLFHVNASEDYIGQLCLRLTIRRQTEEDYGQIE